MKELQRFHAKGESGIVYEIVEYGPEIDASHLGERDTIQGLGELHTTTGSPVNDRGDGTFKIVHTNEIVRRID